MTSIQETYRKILRELAALQSFTGKMAGVAWSALKWKIAPDYPFRTLFLQAFVGVGTYAVVRIWPQIPDVPIYALAVVAALMSLEGMKQRERIVWTLIVFGLAVVELNVSYRQRVQNEEHLASQFRSISNQADTNMDKVLKSEDERFTGVIQNQRREFDAMIARMKLDEKQQEKEFADVLTRENSTFEQAQNMLVLQQQVNINSEAAMFELEAMREEAANRQAPNRIVSTPPINASPTPEVQDTRRLKVEALRLARDIYSWINSVSKEAPKSTFPEDKEEATALNLFSDRLTKEWNERFNESANSMVRDLHITGLILACNPGTRMGLPSETLGYRNVCATRIQQAALDLK